MNLILKDRNTIEGHGIRKCNEYTHIVNVNKLYNTINYIYAHKKLVIIICFKRRELVKILPVIGVN